MKTKEEIVANWLPRYTKRNLEDFGEYILLTNFNKYVEIFANQFNVPILGRDANMISASKLLCSRVACHQVLLHAR